MEPKVPQQERVLPPHADRGQGRPIVFTHGTLMSHEMFEPQLDDLSDEFRVVAYDHRSRTQRSKGPYDLWDLASDCRDVIDALSIDRCVLAGMSMGGFMALRFALRWPDLLDGLILIGSAAQPYSEAQKAEWRSYYGRVRGQPELPSAFVEDESRACFSDETRRRDPELVDRWMERWSHYEGAAVYDEAESWIGQDDITSRLGEITVPVLVLHGDADSAVPLADATATAELLPNARVVRFPDAGHSVNLEAAPGVNDAIRRFVRELGI